MLHPHPSISALKLTSESFQLTNQRTKNEASCCRWKKFHIRVTFTPNESAHLPSHHDQFLQGGGFRHVNGKKGITKPALKRLVAFVP